MKTVALVSGGKDSCFNMMCCIAEGHDIVALANLRPVRTGEIDSYMYQTVGHTAIDFYADAMGLPLFTQTIRGSSLSTGRDYDPKEGDEVEDLFKLLQTVKEGMSIEAVSVGAILSDYQRVRVENVCQRLGLTSLSYLWRRNQEELLREMIDCGVQAKIIKVAAMGLQPDVHLGLDLGEILPSMLKLKSEYGLNECGEGGEYETFVYDCPLFKKKIVIHETNEVMHSDDAFAPVAYLNLNVCQLESKEWDDSVPIREKILQLPIMTSSKWIESHVSNTSLEAREEGGGDSDATGMVMCVPDMAITDEEQPSVQSDDKCFQMAGVRAVATEGTDLGQATGKALSLIRDKLNTKGIQMADITSMSLYIGNMANFAVINKAYKTFFSTKPPVRLCVQANLPRNIALQLDCQGIVTDDSDLRVMHVQSLSHWAPANIGPYSQAVLVGSKLLLAGIVPLVPASLNVMPGGISTQCSVSLIHVQQIMLAMCKDCGLSCVPAVMCYVKNAEDITVAKQKWKEAVEAEDSETEFGKISLSTLQQYCVVPGLPKNVLVEWHLYAWPFLEESADIYDISFTQQYDYYTITSKALYSKEDTDLFSCRITADVTTVEDFRYIEAPLLVSQILQEYSKICEQRSCSEMNPLVKVFFSPSMFDYSYIHKCFSGAIANVTGFCRTHPPVVSLVSVNGLETRYQILAWCQ